MDPELIHRGPIKRSIIPFIIAITYCQPTFIIFGYRKFATGGYIVNPRIDLKRFMSLHYLVIIFTRQFCRKFDGLEHLASRCSAVSLR